MNNGIDNFYALIEQGCNDPKTYEKLMPYSFEVYAQAAIKAKFPKAKVDVISLIKEMKLPSKIEDTIPQWYKDKWFA